MRAGKPAAAGANEAARDAVVDRVVGLGHVAYQEAVAAPQGAAVADDALRERERRQAARALGELGRVVRVQNAALVAHKLALLQDGADVALAAQPHRRARVAGEDTP